MKRFKWSDLLLKATCSSIILILASCSSGTSSGSSTSAPVTSASTQALTIDATGIIPIVGGRATSTYVYVHNNTDKTISGISYSTSTSNTNTSSSFSFKSLLAFFGLGSSEKLAISSSSTSMCSSIAAHGACMLSFTTPVPDSSAFQGSATITAYYGNNNSYSQILNYQSVDSSTINGVLVNSGVSIIANPNTTSYGMVYLYASGSGKNYSVDSMELSKSAFSITQGDVTGTEMTPGWIQAVEISVPAVAAGSGNFNVNLTVLSSVNNDSYASLGTIGVQSVPAASGAILIAGLAPVVNTNTESNGILPIYNAGNQPANSISVAYPTGIIAGPAVSNQCGTTLAPYATCNISFTVTDTGSGSAIESISYAGGSSALLNATLAWYTNNSPLAGEYAPVINFNATQSQNVLVTMVNYGTVTLNNITIPAPTVSSGGGATVSLLAESNTCTTESALGVGASCSYYIKVSKSTRETGYYVMAGFSASYAGGGTYSRVLAIPYTVNPYQPSLTITIPALSIVGNNIDSQTQTITISNVGNAPANIVQSGLVRSSPYLSASGSCGTINAGASCTNSIVKLGPYSNSTESVISDNSESYVANYFGGEIPAQPPFPAAYGAIAATIQPDNQSIAIESVTSTGGGGGNGQTPGTPYIFYGYITSDQTITLTYRNTGTAPITIRGIINPNSGFNYNISPSSTCAESAVVAVNSTCTVVFTDILASNFLGLGNFGASYSMNLTPPTIIISNGTNQFQILPTLPSGFGSVIYATSKQATLTLSSTQASGTGAKVTESNVLANASGYASNIQVITNMEDYFTDPAGPTPGTGNCTQAINPTESGIRTLTCSTISSSNLFGGYVFTLGTPYIGQTLHTQSTVTVPTGQVVSVSGLNSALILH